MRAPGTWARSGFATQLRDQFEHLPQPRRTIGWPLLSSPPRVDGDAPAQAGIATLGRRTALPRGHQAQQLGLQDLAYRRRVMHLGHAHVLRVHARLFVEPV